MAINDTDRVNPLYITKSKRLSRTLSPLYLLISLIAGGQSCFGHKTDGTIETWKQERSTLPDRTWHFGYDAATRLTSAILKDSAQTILKTHGWQYDPGDNRIATKTDAAGLVPTRHNKLNQLLTTGRGPTRITGTLNEPGSVKVNGEDAKIRNQTLFEAYLELAPGTHQIEIKATDFSENTRTQSYQLQIANEPPVELKFDLNGNLTQRITPTGTINYEWDALDRLITINYADTSRSEFTYDGLSRRVRIIERDTSDTITTDKRHLWDDLTIAEERATDGTTVSKRFYPQGVELVTGPNAGTYTYRTDHLGSIREVVNSAGNLSARYDYSAWGEPNLESGTFDLDFRYTGHYYHQPSSLHLAPFRAYDAGLGRWLSADPIGERGGLNLYGYVENDPISRLDPLGQNPYYHAYFYGQRHTGVSDDVRRMAQQKEATGAIAGGAVLACGLAAPQIAIIAMRNPAGMAQGIAALDQTGVLAATGFFAGARYTQKVLAQMAQRDAHAFPEAVRAFECSGTVSKITGGDSIVREILKIPGSYKGKDGVFEFIKEADGSINHRFFRAN